MSVAVGSRYVRTEDIRRENKSLFMLSQGLGLAWDGLDAHPPGDAHVPEKASTGPVGVHGQSLSLGTFVL